MNRIKIFFIILLISSSAFLSITCFLLAEIYNNMPVTIDFRSSLDGSMYYQVRDKETAVKIAQVIIEKRLNRKVDISNISAKLEERDKKDTLGDVWEIVFSDTKDTVMLCMKKDNAEVISISE